MRREQIKGREGKGQRRADQQNLGALPGIRLSLLPFIPSLGMLNGVADVFDTARGVKLRPSSSHQKEMSSRFRKGLSDRCLSVPARECNIPAGAAATA